MYTTIAIVVAGVTLAVAIILKVQRKTGVAMAKPASGSNKPKGGEQLVERARRIQQEYWTPNREEKTRLLEKNVDDLPWEDTLRLLHLVCLEIVSNGAAREQLERLDRELDEADSPPGENRDLLVRLVRRLRSQASPYKPRHVAVWRGNAGRSDEREADLHGVCRNASLTHLGCLEVIRLDHEKQPAELAFISFNQLRGAVFASPAVFRYGKLFFDNGHRDEIVLVPMLYGISWLSPHAFDHDGSMTRFVCFVPAEDGERALSIGVGHQDLAVEADGETLLGLGSIGEIAIVLFVDDPKFAQKCMARGLDAEVVRQSVHEDAGAEPPGAADPGGRSECGDDGK
jgi:hypothetical protein